MPRGYLSVRIDPNNRAHHLYLNNGHYWVHYTLHFDFRKRRIRRSLKTRLLEVAIQRRDELFARLAAEGELVENRPEALVPPRSCRVMKADVGLRAADARFARGDFVEAATMYELTAGRFRYADLGLLAKRCRAAAAECWLRGLPDSDAARCRRSAKRAPVERVVAARGQTPDPAWYDDGPDTMPWLYENKQEDSPDATST
jgi:hypothetical protein